MKQIISTISLFKQIDIQIILQNFESRSFSQGTF